MRRILAVLLLGAAVALAAVPALAGGSNSGLKVFYGDGFDNTACADLPPCSTR